MSSPLINVMSAAAIKAGKGVLRDFGEVDKLQISQKGTANFVTKADVRTEKLLIDELRKARPEYGFLAEESGEIQGKDITHRWIIDPIDGTHNFIHAISYFCIAIALEKRSNNHQEVVAGVIYDPIHNELFQAEKGKGAFLNDRRMMVSRRTKPEESMVVTTNPRVADTAFAQAVKRIESVSSSNASLRCMGATALDLAYIAAGRFDAGWFPPQPAWDMAAGVLLVEEAGGMVSQPDGSPYTPYTGGLLASNRELHTSMVKLLAV